MTDLEALKARLRLAGREDDSPSARARWAAAADAIERLEAEVAKLREALRAAYDDTPGWCDTTRAALKG